MIFNDVRFQRDAMPTESTRRFRRTNIAAKFLHATFTKLRVVPIFCLAVRDSKDAQ